MYARIISSRLLRSMLLALLCLVVGQSAVLAAPTLVLQGQSRGITNWTSPTILDWRELDYVPCRVSISGSAANNQAMTISFPHGSGTTPGFQDLVDFTTSANVTIVSGPTLSDPAGADWSYSLTINYTGGASGSVQFFARLAAGAHL